MGFETCTATEPAPQTYIVWKLPPLLGDVARGTKNLACAPRDARERRGKPLASTRHGPARRIIHPVRAILLASSLPLFLGSLLSDWAYSSTYQIQWLNFAAWLIAGALVFVGAALLWATIDFLRADVGRDRAGTMSILVLLMTFVLALINELVHAKDGWATMPAGLILSVLVFVLALFATWLGFFNLRAGATR